MQLKKIELYLQEGLGLFDSGFLSEHIEIKASIGESLSPFAEISNSHVGSYSVVGASTLRFVSMGNYCSLAEGVKFLEKQNPSVLNSAMMRLENHTPSQIFKTFGSRQSPPVTSDQTLVGHDVWIGSKVKIANGLVIGHGAVLEDSSVVRQHVPPYAIVSGNPAQIVGMRFPKEQVNKLLQSGWYHYDWQNIELNWDNPEYCLAMMLDYLRDQQPPLLGKGLSFSVTAKDELALKLGTWTLEQELQSKFGTSDMQTIFELPEIKAHALSIET